MPTLFLSPELPRRSELHKRVPSCQPPPGSNYTEGREGGGGLTGKLVIDEVYHVHLAE